VIPVDREPVRGDGEKICFDWLVWEGVHAAFTTRPPEAPGPFIIAVQHHKSEDQVPAEQWELWEALRASPAVQIESAAQWNMASKRMEVAARTGDILIALGGAEGVDYLANLYHDAGKPVVPLDLPITGPNAGARKLFAFGQSPKNAARLFRSKGDMPPHSWLSRIQHTRRQTADALASGLTDLLEALAPPRAFGVRLLNPNHPHFDAVEAHFETVVRPVIEDELGYELTVIDGSQPFEHSRIDQEIFTKLHRSRVVLADITGSRPNCFIELGYALGRQLPTMVMGLEGAELPFDITTISGLMWKAAGPVKERRTAFRNHWIAIKNRPPIVPVEPLIP